GTTGGTAMVKEIRPGGTGPYIKKLKKGNGTLFFRADNGTAGHELWKSDGTEAGTAMVKEIKAGAGSPDARAFAVLNSGPIIWAQTTGGPARSCGSPTAPRPGRCWSRTLTRGPRRRKRRTWRS